MQIRAARPDDAEALSAVHVASWRVAYRGLLPDAVLDALDADRWRDLWRQTLTATDWPARGTLLAVAGDELLGFVAVQPTRDDDAGDVPTGELTGIYVAPTHWTEGIGSALVAAAVERLRAAGFREATLWVLRDNARARRFYQGAGWAPDGTRKDAVVAGVPVTEVRYRRAL